MAQPSNLLYYGDNPAVLKQTFELTGTGVTKEGESGKPWRGFDPTKFGRHWAVGVSA